MNGTINKEAFIKKYLKAVKDGDAAIFAGAGTSISSGFLDWKSLVEEFAKEINLDVNKEHDLTKVMQYYYNANNQKRTPINLAIADNFSSTNLNKTVKAMAKLPISVYWTTNYDTLIEEALKKYNRLADVKSQTSQLSYKKNNSDATVYKMHGDINDPNNVVFIKDDYDSYEEKRSLFTTTLKADLISKTFLFIGFSFEDPNLDRILSKVNMLIENNTRDHYCIMRKVNKTDYSDNKNYEYNKVKQELKIDDMARYGIKTLLINEYDEIPEILENIYDLQLRDSIFISGSIECYDENWRKEKVDDFCYNLSKRLIQNENVVISGFGLGIGSNVINGALSEIYEKKYGHSDEYLKLYPFPQDHINHTKLKELWKRYRETIISKSGICIFIFGNKKVDGKCLTANGMFEEFEIAFEQNKKVIPVPTTGYMAEIIYNHLDKNNEIPDYLLKYKDKLLKVKNDGLIDLLVDVVEYIQSYGVK
ncbi:MULTISPECIES: SIR2 family protein [Staphylococcus]|uniref:SIR2 family protein n=1 Tax=Staphylococcus TaxID=1279 RepID=UPI0008A29344|nr:MULTISPECIES: SIR2 family protein [Staphylococcus]MDT4012500.1 SIR2 family protein [Staphylococcus simulans]